MAVAVPLHRVAVPMAIAVAVPVAVMVRGLLQLGPRRLTQVVDEVEPAGRPAPLLRLDLLGRHAVGLAERSEGRVLLVLGEGVCLALGDRPMPLGVAAGRVALDDARLGA